MTGKLIYFMRPVGHLGPIKIGCSKFPEGRLEALAIVSPLRLEIIAAVPGDHATERRLHGMFAKHWLHHEWFDASKDLLALVDYVATNAALPELPEGEIIKLPRKRLIARGSGGSRPPSPMMIAFGAKVLPEYEAGKTCSEIAAIEGCHPQKVAGALRAVGVQVRRGRPQGEKHVADVGRAEEFKRRYEAGETLKAIADDYSLTRERVRQILRKFRVPSHGSLPENRRAPAPLTQAEIGAAASYANDMRPKEIVAKTGLTYSQVARAVKRTGGEVKGTGHWLTRPDDEEITRRTAELYQAGLSAPEIVKRVPQIKFPETVYKYLKKAGVAPRSRRGRFRRAQLA